MARISAYVVSRTIIVIVGVLIAAGLVIAIPAVITGALDWSEVKKEKPAWKLGLIHMLLNLLAFSLNALNLGIRLPAWLSATNVTDVQLGLSVVVTVLLAVSGWIGGRLVYEHGISVARQSKEKWREIARAGGADIPEEKE